MSFLSVIFNIFLKAKVEELLVFTLHGLNCPQEKRQATPYEKISDAIYFS